MALPMGHDPAILNIPAGCDEALDVLVVDLRATLVPLAERLGCALALETTAGPQWLTHPPSPGDAAANGTVRDASAGWPAG